MIPAQLALFWLMRRRRSGDLKGIAHSGNVSLGDKQFKYSPERTRKGACGCGNFEFASIEGRALVASFGYALACPRYRFGMVRARFATATLGTILLPSLKIGAGVLS